MLDLLATTPLKRLRREVPSNLLDTRAVDVAMVRLLLFSYEFYLYFDPPAKSNAKNVYCDPGLILVVKSLPS